MATEVLERIDPALDLFAEIQKLKTQRNAVLLAHYYQEPDIQDVADFIGDSLELSRKAAATNADVIVFAGVHFMAETAKILSPRKKVVIPDLEAACSLADGCPASAFKHFIERYPGHTVISYINCSAAVKALSDIICTSANAVKIVQSVPKDTPIIFAPDQHLGRFVMKESGRHDMVLWPGVCIVHETFSERKVIQLKVANPRAKLIAHPECRETLLRHADFIGSTSKLLQYAKDHPEIPQFIVATESGILHQMKKACPRQEFIPAPPEGDCACNDCPYMKLNTLEKVYLCLRDLKPEVTVPEDIRVRALKPLERMMELSK